MELKKARKGNAGTAKEPFGKAKAKGKAKAGSTLFNLSAFGKAFFDESGEMYGFRLAGYRNTDNGKEYCNIWIKGDDVSVKELPGGDGYAVRIRLLEVSSNIDEDEQKEQEEE